MEETIKMKTINVDGVEIVKDIPASLYSQYVNIGWEVVKKPKVMASLNVKEENKKN